MPRRPRIAPGGYVYHVLNRSVVRMKLFRHDADFQAFNRVLCEAWQREPLRILSYCVMPNHWHFVVWPQHDGQLSNFFRWLAHTHAMRWRVSHHTVGYGHLYQGRFKCFPVQQDDEHLLTVCRYVERNALTARMVERAQDWRWSSLWTRQHGEQVMRQILGDWPVDLPADWVRRVNRPLTEKEIDAMTTCMKRSRPYGNEKWVMQSADRLKLQHTLRPEGRPRQRKDQADE